MTKHFPAYLFFAALAFWAACSKPSPFGSELLDDQLADYAYHDALALKCTVLREDSATTSDRNSSASYFLCGQLNDPAFGTSTSEIFSLLTLANLDPGFDLTTDRVDSVFLILRYDLAGVYGDTAQALSIRVHRLDGQNQLRWDQNYYSNQSLGVAEEIGALDFTPHPNTFDRNPYDTDSTAAKYNYLKIPLSQSFGQFLLSIDSVTTSNDTLFFNELNGIRISVASASGPGAMLAFDLNDLVSRVRLYYSRNDTLKNTFDYYFSGSNKFTRFAHDYAGTPAGQQIGQNNPDLMYVQGMSGLRVKFEFPNADSLENIIVNKAELVLTIAAVPGDPVSFEPVDQLVLTELQGDTVAILISDAFYALGPTLSNGFGLFGGQPETEVVGGNAVKRYRLTMTDRFQAMVDDKTGDIRNRTLYLNVYPQRSTPSRSILYGPQSATFPARLELKYTRIR